VTGAATDPRRAAGARQRAALDPAASVWVQASAGTGKTKVLVDRVLALLLAGAPPQRIRCLTFTKAAAAEMKNRLLRALADWATLPGAALTERLFELLGRRPTPEQEQEAARLFARVLDAPGGLQIQTIHAFCQGLLARFPLEAGVSPRFRLAEERTAAELLAEARADLYAEAELPGRELELRAALEHVLLAGGETRLDQLTAAILQQRAAFERALAGRGVVGVVAVAEAACELAAGETRERLLATALAEPALKAGPLRALCQLMAGGLTSDAEVAGDMAPLLAAAPGERARLYEAYRGAFLTNEGTVRKKLPTKKLAAAAPDLAALFLAEGERLVALEARLAAVDLVADCRALFTLAERLLALYRQRKAAQGLLDYADLIQKTAQLLDQPGQAAWVLYKLDEGIEHLLIDEAQDTSPEQWQVVKQLTAEFHAGQGAHEDRAQGERASLARTVFAVGDAKQSIFRFQGADPAGFKAAAAHYRARAEAVNQRFLPVPLSHSFRSVAAVLRAVDRIFALPAAQAGVAAPEAPVSHAATRLGHAGRVELWPLLQAAPRDPPDPWALPLEQREGQDPVAALAQSLADTLAGWFAATPESLAPESPAWLASKGRPVAPGDVLILVRTRGPLFHALTRALKRRGVAVAGVDRMVLPQQTAVRDLLALGRFLLLPDDDLSLAEVLKGPLGGLDDDDLIGLASGRGEGEGRLSLWRALGERRGLKPAWQELRQRLERLLAQADFVPPYELFAGLLAAGEGRRRWLGRLGEEAADPLDEFLAQALAYERDHAPSLQGFLAWLEQGQLEVKRDLEASGQAVRIMTVHGAKGLQAPIVFLPDTTGLPKPGGALLPDPERRLVLRGGAQLRAVPFAERLRQGEERAIAEEYRRLLYVALTRAEDRLYICGALRTRTLSAECWYALAARALLGLDESAVLALPEPRVVEQEAQSAPPEAPPARPPAPAAAALGDWRRRPPPPEPSPPRPLSPSRPEGAEAPVLSPLAGDAGRWRRGLLIHRLLQSLPALPPEQREGAARRFLAEPAQELGAATVAAWTAEVLAVLALPEAAPLFGPRSQAEVPIVGSAGGTRIAGRLDRLAVTEEAVWLVDYKTNRPPPLAEDAVPEQYLRQLAAYGALLGELYKGKEIKAFLLWTDGPRLMRISAERLARWAP
jgi:ATP-dependent helicase/nuclease subunit A